MFIHRFDFNKIHEACNNANGAYKVLKNILTPEQLKSLPGFETCQKNNEEAISILSKLEKENLNHHERTYNKE